MRYSLPLSFQHVIAPTGVIVLVVLLFLIPQSSELLEYNRSDILAGQWWRILSGNFLHTNLAHLLLNIAGIVLLWALHGEYYSPRRFVLVITVCAIGTTLSLLYLTPQMHQYVGLSGALHGVFVWGALNDIRRNVHTGWVLLAGITVKITFEQIVGPDEDIAALIDASVAIDAHLFGAITGCLLFMLMMGIRHFNKT